MPQPVLPDSLVVALGLALFAATLLVVIADALLLALIRLDRDREHPRIARRWSVAHVFFATQAWVLLTFVGAIPILWFAGRHTGAARAWWLLSILVLQNAVMVAVVVALVRYAYREPVGSAGIAGQNWRRHVALGLAAAVIAIPVSDLLERLCVLGAALSLPPATHDALLAFQQFTSVHKQLIEPLHTPSGLVALLVVAGIIGPFAEEVFFRGLAHTALRHRLGPLWGSVASAAFFALIHVSPLSLIPIFVMGLVLAAVYERTGTLAAPFALHALNNTVAVLLVYFQPDFTFWPFIPVR